MLYIYSYSNVKMDSTACMICNGGGHSLERCPALVEPLRDGFYRGQAEQGDHDHDDDG